MDFAKLRAWWFARQGLDGSLDGASPGAILERAGWARTVGGSNPYLTLFSRSGTSKQEAEDAAARREIYELPSARGCTYILPQADFALGLKVGEKFGGATEIATARKLGVPDSEIEGLCEKVLLALGGETLDPKALKDRLGDAVRNLGEEGKKRGLTTTLPVALGLLQKDGRIIRVPIGGRLDGQRYAYTAWPDSPARSFDLDLEQAYALLAQRFFTWIGPARIEEFQWFSGLGVGASKAAITDLGLAPIADDSDFLALPEDADAFRRFKGCGEPAYALVSSLDSLVLLRRSLKDHVEASDGEREVFAEKGLRYIGHLLDLPSNAVLDRGRLIGLWEFDPFEQEVAVQLWAETAQDQTGKRVPREKAPASLRAKIDATEAFVRDQLGDARSFSLDSPEGRKPLLAALRG